VKHCRRSGIVNRVFDFVTVTSADRLGGDIKQLQPGDANSVGAYTPQACAAGLHVIRRDAALGDHFHVAPNVIGQHHDLEELQHRNLWANSRTSMNKHPDLMIQMAWESARNRIL